MKNKMNIIYILFASVMIAGCVGKTVSVDSIQDVDNSTGYEMTAGYNRDFQPHKPAAGALQAARVSEKIPAASGNITPAADEVSPSAGDY